LIQYIRSDGVDGNVAGFDRITTVNDSVYNEDGTSVSVSVTNTSLFLGGDDEETIEQIRVAAPQVFKTGDRAVTREDFISILKSFAGVADANVWGENEEAELAGESAVQEMLNLVKISLVLQGWDLPDDAFKNTVSEDLYAKSMLTVKYEFITPVFLYVIPLLIVKVASGESMSQTQSDIQEVLDDEFELGVTTKLGTAVKYSNIISSIDDLDGVAYVNMTLEIYKVLSETYNSLYDWGATLDATDIKPETVRLFIDGEYVISDSDNGDDTGSFSSSGSYTISGDVDYKTGVLNVNISPTPSDVYVRYQQDENGNIIPTFRQICQLYEVDIDDISMED
jgi:hypothetical protein